MVRSMFSGVAGLRSHQTKMDVIGNNIANVNTYGFKSARVAFKDSLYQTKNGSADPMGVYGGKNASQIGYGANVGSIDVLHINGVYASTDNPTDCMIDGNGYFMVGPYINGGFDPNDGSVTQLNFTRLGIFKFDGAGNFVDTNLNMVYGYAYNKQPVPNPNYNPNAVDPNHADYDANYNVPATIDQYVLDTSRVTAIQLPKDANGNPVKLEQISIGYDGTISGVDSSNNIVFIAQIALANVPNPNGLESTSNSYYKAKANTGAVTVEVPGEGTTGKIEAGGLEMSNVDLSKEFTDMITTQRGYQACSRIITVTDEMLQELINIKR